MFLVSMPYMSCGPCHSNSRFADTMSLWGSINCGLASAVSFINAKNNGVPTTNALADFAGNMANGIGRNMWAADMYKHGNPSGFMINSMAGYGNPYSNFVGTMGLMACSPPMFFGCMPYMSPCMPMYGGCCWIC